ncbi:hypothetical protein ACF3DV_29015 [Chlorogloeopsis fritschii PCC 9212]|uniref:hypothetical protein n=1 Tax=Chlorogloeopsis fritschii TaxID=1124 RepID=UPI0003111C4C|nr:hypothetical protein [Chlorogloeopsis fritschii]
MSTFFGVALVNTTLISAPTLKPGIQPHTNFGSRSKTIPVAAEGMSSIKKSIYERSGNTLNRESANKMLVPEALYPSTPMKIRDLQFLGIPQRREPG